MMKFVIFILILAGVQLQTLQNSIPLFVAPVKEYRSCLTQQVRDRAHQTIRKSLLTTLALLPVRGCGTGNWSRVAYLNMSDSMQSCPSDWTDRSANGVRLCGRPAGSDNECHSTFYHPDHSYTRVCGRVIGYQFGLPDGLDNSYLNINQAYVDGVSITHGTPRSHIWTFTADRSEANDGCPCQGGESAPPFVRNNYYCESGNSGLATLPYRLFGSDPLWDGAQCESEGSCCSTAPWFTVDLVNPTRDDIEVRICSDHLEREEDTPIHLLELYTQ